MGAVTTFGQRLRQLRRAAGLSQAELAGEGLSASYISLLEAGKRTPSSEALHQLAARLGCSTTQLLDGRPSDRDRRIELELAYAKLAITHGEAQDAATRLEQVLTEDGIPQRSRDEITLLLARAQENLGRLDRAVSLALPLFERATAGESHLPLTDIARLLCWCYVNAGDGNKAVAVGEQALGWARQHALAGTEDYFRLATLVLLALIGLGDFLYARTWADRLLAEAEAGGERAGQGMLYWNAAVLAEAEGRIEDSLRLAERACSYLSEFDDTRNYARLLRVIAWLKLLDQPPSVDEANALLERAHDDLLDTGGRTDLAEWNTVKSAVLLHRGDPLAAESRARQALELLDPTATSERVDALLALHDALSAQRQDEEATQVRRQAFELLGRAPNSRILALQWRDLADRVADAGDLDTAALAYRQALDGAGVRDRSRPLRERVRQLRSQPVLDRRVP